MIFKNIIMMDIVIAILIVGIFEIFFSNLLIYFTIFVFLFLSGYIYNEHLKNKKQNVLTSINTAIFAELESVTQLIALDDIEGFTPRVAESCMLAQDAQCYIVEKQGVSKSHRGKPQVGKFSTKHANKYSFVLHGDGKIFLTDERIVFISDYGSQTINLKKILNVTNLQNGIKIDIEGKQPLIFITGDARLYATYTKYQEINELNEICELLSKQK